MKTKTIDRCTEDTNQARATMIEIAQNQGRVISINTNKDGLINLNTNLPGRRKYGCKYDIEMNPETSVITVYFDLAYGSALEIFSKCRKAEALNGTKKMLRIDTTPAYA